MDKNFHSTVLQRPPHFNEDGSDGAPSDDRARAGSRGGLRDILNPGSVSQAPPALGPPPGVRPPSYHLRSPAEADFHHPPPHFAAPSSSGTNGIARSILTNPFTPASSAGSPLPLQLQAPPAISSSAASSGPPSSLHPISPLHPPAGVYNPRDFVGDLDRERERDVAHERELRDRAPVREKTMGSSFYDPTTDTTIINSTQSEPRVSDTGNWHNTVPQMTMPNAHDSFNYSKPAGDYYNGSYNSPPVTSQYPPGSPVSHSHFSAGAKSNSPSVRATQMASPSIHNASTVTNGVLPPTSLSGLTRRDSSTVTPKVQSLTTPSRAAGVMSFSNILSSSEPVSMPRPKSPEAMDGKVIKLEPSEGPEKAMAEVVEPRAEKSEEADIPEKTNKMDKTAKADKKEKASRRPAKSRSSDVKNMESHACTSRRATSKTDLSAAKPAVKRQANGLPKQKTFSADKEKDIKDFMEQADMKDIDEDAFEIEAQAWKERTECRQREIAKRDQSMHIQRRQDYAEAEAAKLLVHANSGKRRYDEMHYDAALQEVREQELYAEKERKKDMQRKRRREKSMATTIEAQMAALAKASAATDDAERAKHLREAERANKKVQQTKLVLQKGIKGPTRNGASIEPNLEGGTMATFQAENMEPGKSKKGGRAGARLKKSKEQKQAEKDAAEAAQAAIDAGEELPSREEVKIRIKVNKGKGSKDKDDADRDKENRELREDGELEKEADEPRDTAEPKFQSKGYNQIYDQILRDLARKDVSKVYRLASDSYSTKSSNLKKTGILASKEAKRWQLRTNKGTKDLQARAKRVMRDMMGFWKRNEREERDLRKAAEKQELENARKEEADREAARQKRKLNFLISQTELYSHFIGKKIKTQEVERSTDHPEEADKERGDKAPEANHLDVDESVGQMVGKVTNFENLDFDAEDESTLRAAAVANAQNAIAEAQQKARAFNKDDTNLDEDGEMNFQNPTGMGDVEIEQPKMLNAQLKEYQLKGLNWLVNLYEQGINGILADEMGLGKTVQSISVMAYLAEKYGIWGPFLVVCPASTLHNWQQEIVKFVPDFKILPYWGNAADRKVLRKFWDRKHTTYKQDAPFHVMVTSYQMVVSDVAYFQKMKWQYMILDEAQAIKSSQSSRWKCLLSFHCRNRLLLTGTPIQNNMQELWALLHFIMPTLFDSHDEFSEWFSKDIESHAQSNTKLNEDQLKRLHMILKPFMLRRVKKHVQKELGDKIELDIFCNLTYRQRALYSNLRNQISIMDLIEKATIGDDDSASLMNLVMQFRKVCNHPDLFERADTSSPFSCSHFGETGSFVREGNKVSVGYSTRNRIEYRLPELVWQDTGRLAKPSPNNQGAGFRNRHLDELMNIWTPDNIKDSLSGTDNFSWLRFSDTSAQEVYHAGHQDVFTRAVAHVVKARRLGKMKVVYEEPEERNWTPAHALFNICERADGQHVAEATTEGILKQMMNVARARYEDDGLGRLEQAASGGATAPPIEVYCNSRAAVVEREETLFNIATRKLLYGPNLMEEKALVTQKIPLSRYPPPPLLPAPDSEKRRFTSITVPSMRRFVTDSGKLAKLDELLRELKEGGHRVLLYFQMTRMIDLMEEYLTYRNYKYCRLDGSTKLEDRRDTVADFQTRPEIFIFLLSTRAGGLGINLTSADTVIFYDSDWNPTIDSQAMDRAHRLGQTRQVTVYRLITRGTIEERIRKRAMQKEEVQRVVISGGGGGGVDFSGRRAPESRNRDIAMWLADDEQAELIERREKEMLESGELDKMAKKKGGSKKKKAGVEGGVSLDEMYHEGEGNFDDNKPSGAATPTADVEARAGKRKKPSGGKKAKTTKQRLAIADGEA